MKKSLVYLCIGVIFAVVGAIAPVRKENIVFAGRGNGVDYAVSDSETFCGFLDGIDALMQKLSQEEENGVPVYSETQDKEPAEEIKSFSWHSTDRLSQTYSYSDYDSDAGISERRNYKRYDDKEMYVYITEDSSYYVSKGIANSYNHYERSVNKDVSGAEDKNETTNQSMKFDIELFRNKEIQLLRLNEFIVTENGQTKNLGTPDVWIDITDTILGDVFDFVRDLNSLVLEKVGSYFKNNTDNFSVDNGFYMLKDNYLEDFFNTNNGRFTVDLSEKTKATVTLAASFVSGGGSSSGEDVLEFYNINNTVINLKKAKKNMSAKEWAATHDGAFLFRE